jgi:hypothetical protein
MKIITSIKNELDRWLINLNKKKLVAIHVPSQLERALMKLPRHTR